MATEDIKEDFLEVDSKRPGQNYACISFVSPEKILKQMGGSFLIELIAPLGKNAFIARFISCFRKIND